MKTFAEKQNAVMTLLEHSVLLSYAQKLDLVDIFPALSEKQIDALGEFLSTEQHAREEFADDIEAGVQKVLSDIVGSDVTADDDNRIYVGTGKPTN